MLMFDRRQTLRRLSGNNSCTACREQVIAGQKEPARETLEIRRIAATATASVLESSLNQAPDTPEVSEEKVRIRAYQLYKERGREDGREAKDWLQAEAEMS
jgi:hypothetical protein